MQEVRRFKPSTVSRRMAVVTGFYRTCVIDAVLEHSPADYVRRPLVPAESPTLGLSHLQFEALLSVARESDNRNECGRGRRTGVVIAVPREREVPRGDVIVLA
jgi:site-specific recombinase XerD